MRYALPAKKLYPIETIEHIKTASVYFDKYLDKFHPAERIAIANTMEKRASELGVELNNDWIYNYSTKRSAYSPEFDLHMKMRKEACMGKKISHGEHSVEAVDLLTKVASLKDKVKPKEMVELIADFDKKAGLINAYDTRVRDPYFTVYGSSINPQYDSVKLASNMSETRFEKLASRCRKKLAAAYGEKFANEFSANPVDVYKSMPTPDKVNIMNIVQSEEDGND